MKIFRRGKLTFEVVDAGPKTGTPVVLLHGFPQSAQSWNKVAGFLANEGYRCIAPNQRGYSKNARPVGAKYYKPTELVEDVIKLIDQLDGKKVHLVGHDWGGIIAWLVADRAPEKLRSLTVVSVAHPRAYRQSFFRSRQFLQSWYILFFQLPAIPEALLLRKKGRANPKWLLRTGLKRAFAQDYVDRFAKDPSALTGALNWYRAIRFGLRQYHAEAIKVPTLFVWSTKEIAISRKAAYLTEQWVKAPYVFRVLEGVSHWIPEEKPKELANLVRHHIRNY